MDSSNAHCGSSCSGLAFVEVVEEETQSGNKSNKNESVLVSLAVRLMGESDEKSFFCLFEGYLQKNKHANKIRLAQHNQCSTSIPQTHHPDTSITHISTVHVA